MDVLLINPAWDCSVSRKGRRINRAWPPLDLLNCAALLEREGIRVDVLDARARWVAPQEIARISEAYDKVFVTSSPLDRWQCPNLELEVLFERLGPLRHREWYLTGVHGTHYPDYVLGRTSATAVVRGEPEWTVLEICRGKRLAEIEGLTYRDGERVVENPPRALVDLTKFPVPAFHLVNWDLYHYELMGERFAVLETTRGCPFPCTFCMRDMYGGRAYRLKGPQQVAQEVACALDSGARTGYFIDLEFSLRREATLQVCEALMPFASRWTWCCQTRADSVDKELLTAMKAAGCALIHFGVETGSPRLMETIDKRITLEQIEQGVACAKQAGIDTAGFFMMGFPGETDADRRQTLEFAKRLAPTYASFHIASPYPGTPLRQFSKADERYPESVLEGEALKRLKRWERETYRRYYLRPGYVTSLVRQGRLRSILKQAGLLRRLL